MRHKRTRDERGERGSVMVIATLAMTALLLFAALAIDVSFVWSSRTQGQSVSDAAALAAASEMIQQVGTNPETVTLPARGGGGDRLRREELHGREPDGDAEGGRCQPGNMPSSSASGISTPGPSTRRWT